MPYKGEVSKTSVWRLRDRICKALRASDTRAKSGERSCRGLRFSSWGVTGALKKRQVALAASCGCGSDG